MICSLYNLSLSPKVAKNTFVGEDTMTIYDFFREQIVPWFKGEYQDFSSKRVDGYSLFVSEWKKKKIQAMVTPDVFEQLQDIVRKFTSVTKDKEEDLHKSQISRWYVNGFISAYNNCRKYDVEHPSEEMDFMKWAQKLKSSDDLEQGEWHIDKFRRYTIYLGRHEGTLFYIAEKGCRTEHVDNVDETSVTKDSTVSSSSDTLSKTEFGYEFPDGLIQELYDEYNDLIFRNISTLEEFKNILVRKPHTERLAECAQKKMQMYKLLNGLCMLLPESVRKLWLNDIANECGYKVDIIQKKHTGSESSTNKYSKIMKKLDHIFEEYMLE